MDYLVTSIKKFFIGEEVESVISKSIEIPKNNSKEMTAYILDASNPDRRHVLAKETDIYWRTYFVGGDVKIIEPSQPIRSVFCP